MTKATEMGQESDRSISVNPMLSALLTQPSNNQNSTYLHGHHHMEFTEIILTILLVEGDRAQLYDQIPVKIEEID